MNHHEKMNPTAGQRTLFLACLILIVGLLFCFPAYGQPPDNDECVDATVITSIPFTDNVNTTTATNNPDDPMLNCNGGGGWTDGNTVWYVWTPIEDITVNISTDGSTEPDGDPLDTAHGIFTGTCNNLTEVACVDIGLTDNLIFKAMGGVTYYFKFGEFLDGVGGGNLVVTVAPPPEPKLFVLESTHDGISPPIRTVISSLGLMKSTSETPVFKEVPRFMRNAGKGDKGATMDLLQKKSNFLNYYADIQTSMGPSSAELLQIFNGAENDDNARLLSILLAPPDTDGDVGPNHYVQMTNLLTTIYDKSGKIVLGPFPNNIFWKGTGGLCQSTNQGDPVVLYDEETDRWFVSQFAFDSRFTRFSLCVACSETGDPTGRYFGHEFNFTDIGFPDYPKYGFVTNSIGVMANMFTPPSFGFNGTGLGAIDKAEAFSPNKTTMVFFKLNQSETGFAAGDNDGPVFDNMPPTFATNNNGMGNTIDFWEIEPDFAIPANSTISEVASIPVSPFDGSLCPAFREQCIDQPGSGTGTFPNNVTYLEAISDILMHRLQLRDFGGGDKRAVVNHTVNANRKGRAGIRWYEFRNDGNNWSLYQENTFSPDKDHRWMGSIAMNKNGDIGLGYSISSQQTYTSIGVAGQTADRTGTGRLNVGELVVHDGNVDRFVQRQTARWGDYSAMSVDPVDGTFWYTQEYAEPNQVLQPPTNPERYGWATKIAQVRLGGAEFSSNEVAAAEKEIVSQNYPNPFNPETEIRFQLSQESHVTVKIFNSLGQEIRDLVNSRYEAGNHNLRWNGKDNHGNSVASGVYFFKIQTDEFSQVKKMNLMK